MVTISTRNAEERVFFAAGHSRDQSTLPNSPSLKTHCLSTGTSHPPTRNPENVAAPTTEDSVAADDESVRTPAVTDAAIENTPSVAEAGALDSLDRNPPHWIVATADNSTEDMLTIQHQSLDCVRWLGSYTAARNPSLSVVDSARAFDTAQALGIDSLVFLILSAY